MEAKLKMIYWKGEKFWVGKLNEHPEIMAQGETLEELEENLKEAYILMIMDDVPPEHKIKISIERIEGIAEDSAVYGKDHDSVLYGAK